MVLYLDASNTSSYPDTGTVWYDLSGNENNGTLDGATYSSNGGGSISFDGSNDDVTIQDDNTLDITNDITISYSLEPNWGTWSPFIAKGTHNNWNYGTWVGNDKGIDIDHGSSGSVIKPLYTATSEMANGKISVITISRNSISGLIKTYVDGVLNEYYRVNYVLRGMPLPKGKHVVEFKFEPQSVAVGSSIAIFCSTLIYLLLGFVAYKSFKRS